MSDREHPASKKELMVQALREEGRRERELRSSKEQVGPFVVGDGGGTGETRFRTMRNGFSAWTLDIDDALQFARRKDAELYCAEDEDAWQILPVPRAAPEPGAIHPESKVIEDLRALAEFAYKQGFHELGYDPIKALLTAAVQPDQGIAAELRDALDQAIRCCACSVAERDSGHLIDCPAPAWRELLDRAQSVAAQQPKSVCTHPWCWIIFSEDGQPACTACRTNLLGPSQPSNDALRKAAEAVCAYDWSDNDDDAVLAVERLRRALTKPDAQAGETPPCIWRLGCQRPALCKDRGHCMGNEGTAQGENDVG